MKKLKICSNFLHVNNLNIGLQRKLNQLTNFTWKYNKKDLLIASKWHIINSSIKQFKL